MSEHRHLFDIRNSCGGSNVKPPYKFRYRRTIGPTCQCPSGHIFVARVENPKRCPKCGRKLKRKE